AAFWRTSFRVRACRPSTTAICFWSLAPANPQQGFRNSSAKLAASWGSTPQFGRAEGKPDRGGPLQPDHVHVVIFDPAVVSQVVGFIKGKSVDGALERHGGERCRQSEPGKVLLLRFAKGGLMPAERLSMRKVREVLRLKYACGAS